MEAHFLTCPAFLGSLSVTSLDKRPVALLNGLVLRLLLEGDLASLLKVLLADLLLGGRELGYVCLCKTK